MLSDYFQLGLCEWISITVNITISISSYFRCYWYCHCYSHNFVIISVIIITCNGLSPYGCRADSWTNADILFNEPFWTNSMNIYGMSHLLPMCDIARVCIEVYCLLNLSRWLCDGFSPDRWQAITWTTADLFFIEAFWTDPAFTLLKYNYCDLLHS